MLKKGKNKKVIGLMKDLFAFDKITSRPYGVSVGKV